MSPGAVRCANRTCSGHVSTPQASRSCREAVELCRVITAPPHVPHVRTTFALGRCYDDRSREYLVHEHHGLDGVDGTMIAR